MEIGCSTLVLTKDEVIEHLSTIDLGHYEKAEICLKGDYFLVEELENGEEAIELYVQNVYGKDNQLLEIETDFIHISGLVPMHIVKHYAKQFDAKNGNADTIDGIIDWFKS